MLQRRVDRELSRHETPHHALCLPLRGSVRRIEKQNLGHEKVRRKLFHMMIDISRISLIDYLRRRSNLFDVLVAWPCWRRTHTMLLNISLGSRLFWYSRVRHRSIRQG